MISTSRHNVDTAERIARDCDTLLSAIRYAPTRGALDAANKRFLAYAAQNGVHKVIRDHVAKAYAEELRRFKPVRPPSITNRITGERE